MTLHASNLPKQVTDAYWAKTAELLQKRHKFNRSKATKAIAAYRAALARNRIGDAIYHLPVEETAEGIVQGGYGDYGQSQSRKATPAARE